MAGVIMVDSMRIQYLDVRKDAMMNPNVVHLSIHQLIDHMIHHRKLKQIVILTTIVIPTEKCS